MNPNKLTTKAQAVIQEAQLLAQQANHAQIDNDHFLKVLLEVDTLVFVYKKLGVNLGLVKQMAEKNLASKTTVQGGQLTLSYESNRILTDAWTEAQKMKDEFIAVEHILLALVRGKFRSSSTLRMISPTIPVAPTTATFILFVFGWQK